MRVSTDIVIDPDFAALMPPHTEEEAASLATSITQDGCRDPLIVWHETDALLDGHQRKGICDRLGLAYGVKRLKFPDRHAAMIWIINNQLARRNITTFQRAELALKLKPLLAARAAERMRLGRPPSGSNPIGRGPRTDEAIGEKVGLNATTIAAADQLLKRAEPDVLSRLRTGKLCISKAYAELRGKPDANEYKRKMIQEERSEITRLMSALEEIRSYEPPLDETPRETVDKLQDMAARAIERGTDEGKARTPAPTRRRTTDELKAEVEARRKVLAGAKA